MNKDRINNWYSTINTEQETMSTGCVQIKQQLGKKENTTGRNLNFNVYFVSWIDFSMIDYMQYTADTHSHIYRYILGGQII